MRSTGGMRCVGTAHGRAPRSAPTAHPLPAPQLDEKKRNLLLMFLSFLWGPMPGAAVLARGLRAGGGVRSLARRRPRPAVMIWAACLVEFIKGITSAYSRAARGSGEATCDQRSPATPVAAPPATLPAAGDGWEDFVVLLILQFANATIGFIEERNAGDAIAALKQQLAPICHVCRDGKCVAMLAPRRGGGPRARSSAH